jgi:penicillin-binding protein 1C
VKKYYILGAVCISLIYVLYLRATKVPLLQEVSFSTAVYDRRGELLRLVLAADDTYRLFVPLEAMPLKLREAVLKYEDQYFYWHWGINPVSLLRAIKSYLQPTGRIVGASTITMQLARIYYQLDSSSLSGKLWQMLYALKFELLYSKAEILTAYLNLAPYGHNIEGVGAASLIYFGRPVAKLTFPEILALAVLPQNPTKRTPTRQSGLQELERIRLKLARKFPNEENASLPIAARKLQQLPQQAPHFVNQLLEQQKYWGKSVKTSLDLKIQKVFEEQMRTYIWRNSSLGVTNAAALLVDWRSLEVLAMVGSNNFYHEQIQGQVNGTNALRSPGSATKPFIYALALEQGLIHPLTMLKDAPKNFGYYSPKNFDKDFMGALSASDALVFSRNIPAVDLLLKLEPGSFYNILKTLGVRNLKTEDFYGLALALGGFEISMQDLARLYASLANLGVLRDLQFEVEASRKNNPVTRLFSPEAAYLTLSMLEHNLAVDALPQHSQNVQKEYKIYWKTGTSWGFRDAWAVGVFGQYVLVVWVGNFDGSSNMHFIGRSMAGPLFFELIRAMAVKEKDLAQFNATPTGLNIIQTKVCAVTGHLDTPSCPKARTVEFIPGKSPIKSCAVHKSIPINILTGKRACFYDPQKTVLQTFEFLDSDLLKIYSRAGITKKTPPAFEDDCPLDITRNLGQVPSITLPAAGVAYNVWGEEEISQIPFQAVADSDVQQLHWFVQDKYVASSAVHEVVFWQVKARDLSAAGSSREYEVKVVDNFGRFAVRKMKIGIITKNTK